MLQSDTGLVQGTPARNSGLEAGEGDWVKSPTPNLVRYKPSGVYFARAKVGGKLIRRSLKTKVYSVATIRLATVLTDHRSANAQASEGETGRITFGEALAIFESRLDADPSIKPSTKGYRRLCATRLLKTWTGLRDLDVRKITSAQCLEWASRFAQRYSPTVYNNTVGTLRMVLEIAIKAGARCGNPAAEVEKVPTRSKKLQLPSQEQFRTMVQFIAERGGRFSGDCALLVQFLAYGGFRKTEAARVNWGDFDMNDGVIAVRACLKNG